MDAILYYLSHSLAINKINAFCTFVVYTLAAGIGWFTTTFVAMISLTILDYILWFSFALYNKELNWKKLSKGIFKFPLYYVAIYAGFKLDELLPGFLQVYGPVHNFMVIYIGVVEFLSVSKWLMILWVPLPGKLLKLLERYKDDMNWVEWFTYIPIVKTPAPPTVEPQRETSTSEIIL